VKEDKENKTYMHKEKREVQRKSLPSHLLRRQTDDAFHRRAAAWPPHLMPFFFAASFVFADAADAIITLY